MQKNIRLLRVIFVTLFVSLCYTRTGAYYDNRFIPLFIRPTTWLSEQPSLFGFEVFAATGREAWGKNDKRIGVPELYGFFDLVTLAKAFEATGRENPIPTIWRVVQSIPYRVTGKIQAQGITFNWHQRLFSDLFAFGAQWSFMRVNSTQSFFLLDNNNDSDNRRTNIELGDGDRLLLDSIRRQMFIDVGLEKNHAANIGPGDMDFYMQLSKRWDYECKCRSLDIGARIGLLAPVGNSREQSVSGSIPLGGNGHWGIYGSFHSMFELREDLKAGFLFRVSKRFARVKAHRVSVVGEPRIFGALVTDVRVNPGPTVVFSPFIALENIREGLALGLTYTLTKHQQDSWEDRSKSPCVPLNFCDIEELSEWGSSYFTLNALYDFGKMKVERSFDPTISFRWDVPFELFVTRQVTKTHKVSFGVDFVF